MPDLHATIAKIPLFCTLEPQEIAELVNLLGVYEFAAGQPLMQEKQPPGALCILLQGQVSVEREKPEGGSDHICDIKAGECVGEVEIIDGAPCTASVIAQDGVSVAYITRENLDMFFSAYPVAANKILRQMVKILAARLRQSNVSYSALMSIADGVMS